MSFLLSFQVLQAGGGTLPTAHVQPLGNLSDRQRGFPTQPCGHRHLFRCAPVPLFQLGSRPSKTIQFLSDDALGLGLRALPPQFPGIVLTQLPCHPVQQFTAEAISPQTPSPPHRLPLHIIGLLRAACLHAPLKFLARLRRVPTQPMLAQQTVHPDPARTVRWGGQIPPNENGCASGSRHEFGNPPSGKPRPGS